MKAFFLGGFCERTRKAFKYKFSSVFAFLPPEPLIREKLMSGKLLIEWRHDLCAEITKKRYINDQEMLRLAHAEIVNLFFPLETSDESDEINSETSQDDKSSKFYFSSFMTSRSIFMSSMEVSQLKRLFICRTKTNYYKVIFHSSWQLFPSLLLDKISSWKNFLWSNIKNSCLQNWERFIHED